MSKEMNLIFDKLVKDYYLKNMWYILFYLVVILLTWPFETISLSNLYSRLVTSIKTKVNLNELFNFKDNIIKGNVFGIIILIFLVWILLILFYALKGKIEENLLPDYIGYIRLLLINGTINSRKENYSEIKVGEYLTMISELTNTFEDILFNFVNTIAPTGLGLIIINLFYYYTNISLGILGTFLILIRLYITNNLGKDYLIKTSKRIKQYIELSENYSDVFNNTMNIHLNDGVSREEKRQKKKNEHYSSFVIREMSMKKNITFVTNILAVIFFVVILIYSYSLYLKNKISLATLLTITFIETKLVSTWMDLDHTLIRLFKRIGIIYAAKDRLYNILKDSDDGNKRCKVKDGSIKIQNLNFSYNKKQTIFNNLNLDIESGNKVGILGRSGSGKSTLMNILLRFQSPNKGTIKIGGCDIKNINIDDLRKEITYVNQKTTLFNDTVLNNIKYGNNITDNDVTSFIKKYNLESIYSGLTDGINSNTGVNGSKLSLGMQKVTILLRGIFKQSKIYIFDEPLAGLDQNSREKVIRLIDDIPKSKTIIVVTHDPEIISHLDIIYELDKLDKK